MPLVEKPKRRPTVLIADDHPIVLDGLVALLKDRFDVVGTVSDGTRLLDDVTRLRPDIVVTDISMPGLDGLEVLRRLKVQRSDTRVIVLTMHAGGELATEAMREGAYGFVLKQSASDELVTAINEVLQGRNYLTPAVTRDVMARMAEGSAKPDAQLTTRQREVLRLITEGHRTKEIAAILNLSTRTVETHKYEMMQVLGVQTTVDLVRYAIEHRLIAN